LTGISSIQNFRDLGGLRTWDGRRIRKGLLLRSGSLISASDEDVSILKNEYNLARVFDLRSRFEIGMAPDREIEGVRNINLELKDLAGEVWKQIINESADHDPMERLVELAHTKKVQELAAQVYIYLACNEGAKDNYRFFLESLADDTPGATLWHCSFGKDRTGVASALILAALGCSKNTILGDYSISSALYAPRVVKVMELVPADDPERDKVEKVVRTFIGANARYFEDGLHAGAVKFGGFREYFTKGLGLDMELIHKLRNKYLE